MVCGKLVKRVNDQKKMALFSSCELWMCCQIRRFSIASTNCHFPPSLLKPHRTPMRSWQLSSSTSPISAMPSPHPSRPPIPWAVFLSIMLDTMPCSRSIGGILFCSSELDMSECRQSAVIKSFRKCSSCQLPVRPWSDMCTTFDPYLAMCPGILPHLTTTGCTTWQSLVLSSRTRKEGA